MEIKQAWYRISVKALIYNDKGEFLLVKESNGVWDFPGGGLDHGENPIFCLKRELNEEMGLKAKFIAKNPSYFLTAHKPDSKTRPYIANVFYKTELENLKFTPSDECVELSFFNKETAKNLNLLPNVKEFLKLI